MRCKLAWVKELRCLTPIPIFIETSLASRESTRKSRCQFGVWSHLAFLPWKTNLLDTVVPTLKPCTFRDLFSCEVLRFDDDDVTSDKKLKDYLSFRNAGDWAGFAEIDVLEAVFQRRILIWTLRQSPIPAWISDILEEVHIPAQTATAMGILEDYYKSQELVIRRDRPTCFYIRN